MRNEKAIEFIRKARKCLEGEIVCPRKFGICKHDNENCPIYNLDQALALLQKQPKCKTCGGSGEVDDTIRSVRAGIDINKPCPVCQDLKRPPELTTERLINVLKQPPEGEFTKLSRSVLADAEKSDCSPVHQQALRVGYEACDCLDQREQTIDQQAAEIERLKKVMRKCIKAMEGSNCLELEWLEQALKGGTDKEISK